jgi:CRP-like cAMP-binding protein
MDVGQLKRIPLFSDAADEELKKVAVFAESKEVPAGTEVVREGGFSTELLAIEDGTAEVTREGKKVAELKKGDIFGETGLLEDEMRNSTVIATSPLKLISMGHFELKRLKKAAPNVYARIENLVQERKGS